MRKERFVEVYRKKPDFVKFSLVFFLFNFAFLSYYFALRYDSVQKIMEYKSHVIFLCVISLSSMIISTNIVFFSANMSLFFRCGMILMGAVYMLLIFFVDQGTTEEEFKYGYWASRGYLYIFLGIEGCLLLVFWVFNLFCIRLRLHKLVAIVIALILVVSLLRLVLVYSFRKQGFKIGVFGKKYNPDESKCHIDVDTFLGSQLFPRFMFQKMLTTYWCNLDEDFVKRVPEPSSLVTTIEIDCIDESIEITLLKSISRTNDHFTYEDMRSPGNYGQFPVTKLQKNILQQSKIVHLPKSKSPQTYTYSSLDFETVRVICGNYDNIENALTEPMNYKKGNIFVEPAKRIDEGDLRKLSISSPNLIILFFDSESRKSFEFNFPKSLKYIEKNIIPQKHFKSYPTKKKKKKINKYVVNEFFSHHVVGWNTLPQTLAMFNGYMREYDGPMKVDEPWEKDGIKDKKFNSGIHNEPFWELLKKPDAFNTSHKSYLTVFSSDDCNEWTTLYNGNQKLCDYVHVEPFCFPKFTDPEKPIQSFKGPFAASRKCLYQKEAPAYVFEYLKKIEKLYPSTSKAMISLFLDAHEATGESGRYLDEHLLEYLKFLVDEGVLDDSIVFFLGDHGNHMSILSNLFYKEGDVGGRNPALMTITPTKYLEWLHGIKDVDEQEIVLEKLTRNENRLITAFDLHKTWCDVVGVHDASKWNKVGKNILLEEISYDRNCEMAGIPYGTLCKKLLCDNGKDNEL